MTLPNERTRAIRNARNFLRSLLDPKQTPRVPKQIREQAYWVLRHFPSDGDIEQAAERCPNLFWKIEGHEESK
jgi:hypothetical protein